MSANKNLVVTYYYLPVACTLLTSTAHNLLLLCITYFYCTLLTSTVHYLLLLYITYFYCTLLTSTVHYLLLLYITYVYCRFTPFTVHYLRIGRMWADKYIETEGSASSHMVSLTTTHHFTSLCHGRKTSQFTSRSRP